VQKKLQHFTEQQRQLAPLAGEKSSTDKTDEDL
jgi:hypothetical protein